VRKAPSAFCMVLSVLCLLSISSLAAHAQERDRDREHPNGIVQDWSQRHAVFPRSGSIQSLIAVQNDPRAQQSWQESIRKDWHRYNRHRLFHHAPNGIHTDWSIILGGATTAKSMYPAKFTFDPGATPDCTTDFIVFPVAAVGGTSLGGASTQPNIVAFNDLYSGTAPGPTGLCNSLRQSFFTGTDDVTSASTFWSYNVRGAGGGGQVTTSPALSLDGTRVAFVESGSGATRFHVLAWKGTAGAVGGDGADATNAQNVLSPKTINTFTVTAPVAGSGTATDLGLGSADDTLSSPFVDYVNDVAYVGNDSGVLFRIKNVFCTTPACTGGGSPAPSLDGTWGSGGALTTGCTGALTGPVEGGPQGNIFVGCSDGTLYGFTPAGAVLTGSPLSVGIGGATGGIVDPPLIDAVNGFVYVVSGNAGAGAQVVVQTSTASFASKATANLGVGSFNVHAPAFNDAYFTGSGTALLYEVAGVTAPAGITLYGVTFGAGHAMTPGPAANVTVLPPATQFEISPLTSFFSGTEDRIFESTLGSGASLASFNVNSFPAGVENVILTNNGTSGIIVDNSSGLNQAASIYFGSFVAAPANSNLAMKVTQSGLQ
jgi:hypothetical protein